MNTLKKLVQSQSSVSGGSAATSTSSPSSSGTTLSKNASATSQDYALHLQHLKRVFESVSKTPSGSSISVTQDDRLYSLVPIFVKLFRNTSVDQIQQQFPDIASFGTALAKLLVHEIKKRAGDRSSEGASVAIVDFLGPNDFSHGWQLLASLQIMSPCGPGRLADFLCATALPSTIVKSFYLFFDLPPANADSEQAANRHNLAAVTSEILCNLLRNNVGAEELAKKDDLALLFIAASSPCPPHNVIWKTCCQEALCVLARHSLSPPVLGYVHAKGCLKICVDNMRNVHQLSLDDIFGIFQYISVFLQQAFDKSQTMVDDFRVVQGFAFMTEFGLRLAEESHGHHQMIEHFVAIVKDLCVHGPTDLRVILSQSPFKLVSFQLPKPKGPPFSIRCLDAFQCLQDMFIKTASEEEAKCVLLAMNELLVWDEANYFVIDSALNTLSALTAKVALLQPETQNIFFNLLRHVVIELNHVPCKELAAIALALREAPLHSTFFKLALQSLKRILFHDVTFQDVYRDVGLVEVLTHKFLQAEQYSDFSSTDLMDVCQSMLKQNNLNCPLFREAGGSQHLLSLANSAVSQAERAVLLTVVQHLLTSVGCDDDMQHLLTCFNNTLNTLEIKQDLLRCLCAALRESHRSRIAFRKSGAFVSLVSAIVALEGQFQSFSSAIYAYLSCIFETLTTAMRYEPSNAKHFQSEIRWSALTDALRLLGSFQPNKTLVSWPADAPTVDDKDNDGKFFSGFFFKPESVPDGSTAETCACLVFRCLYLMALDGYRHGWADNFEALLTDAPIVHAGAVLVFLDLLPAAPIALTDKPSLLVFVSEVLRSLVRHERNQQLMCEAGMVNELLAVCEAALAEENHPLSGCIQYILERLAAQSLRPKELRTLLRLRFFQSGCRLSLSRIKTLVSMITLRDYQNTSPPAFVEFDLSYEGFGGLFLPSLAPQAISSYAVHGALTTTESGAVLGGMGSGPRVFPPTSGFSVVMWFCIDCFVASESIRLIDITRHIAKPPDALTCLSLHLVIDGNCQPKLLLTTREHSAPENPEAEPSSSSDVVVLDMAVLKEQESLWHCLTISLGKTLVKSGYCNIYLDGKNLGQYKLTYIPQNPGGGAAHLATATSVSATIGTQPVHRKPCKLRWRLANAFILEEALTLPQVQLLYGLGPGYHGNFQDPQCTTLNLVDEKVLFGLNPLIVSEMSISKIRRIYNKEDARAIAKHLALSSHDSSTPVKMIHNSAAHLRGPSRGVGSAVVGYLGVRLFSPKPAHQALLPIGGVWSLLGMVAMSSDTEYLYAAMKCLFCALRTNTFLREQMSSCGGFQFVAMMLKKKKDILNAHVLHLAFSMIATGDVSREGASLYDRKPIEDLLSDIQLWQACSADLQRSVFEHFIELSKEHHSNAKLLCETGLIRKVFQFLLLAAASDSLDHNVLHVCGDLLKGLLRSSGKSSGDVLSFAQYMVCTIPSSAEPVSSTSLTIRNIGLQIVRSLTETYPDLVSTFLGFDWLLCFLHPALQWQSIVLVLDVLCDLLLKNANNLLFFREARHFGSWLRDSTQHRRRNDIPRLIPSHQSSLQVNLEVVTVSGFYGMQLLLPELHRLSVTWMSTLSLFLGRRLEGFGDAEAPLNLDTIWLGLFATSPGMPIKFREYHIVCPEAAYVVLGMVRQCVEQGGSENANCVLQVLIYMYHNWPEFGQFALSGEFVSALACCLFTSNDEDPQVIVKLSNTRRLVLDLLRMVITDSLALPADKAALIAETWMEAYPEAMKAGQVTLYQTELAEFIMDHIMAINVVVDTSGMWIHPAGNKTNVAPNVFALCYRLMDRIWKGSLNKSDARLLDFLIYALTSSMKMPSLLVGTEMGFLALNRLVLFQLSRPADGISLQMAVLDALHKLVDHRGIIFHPANQDMVFLACLAYVLALLVDRMPISCDVTAQSTWHTYSEMSGPVQEGWQLLQSSSCNVWNILSQSKGKELRELLKPPPAVLDSDLPDIKDFLRESCHKIWVSFLQSLSSDAPDAAGKSAAVPTAAKMGMAAVKKLPGMSLVRAYSRQQSTKTMPVASVTPKVAPALFLHQVRMHVLLVNQYVQDQLSHLQRGLSSLNRLVEDEWLQCEREFLLRERALWGIEEPWKFGKWMLDMSEGPQRVRKVLVENADFFQHYAYRDVPTDAAEGQTPAKQKIRYPISADSKPYYDEEQEGKRVRTLLKASKGGGAPLNISVSSSLSSEDLREPTEMTETEEENNDDDDDEEGSDDTVIRRLMEEGDTITYAFRCARVEGLDAFEGLMLLGREHFYLIDGFTLLSTREIRDIESIPAAQREPVLPSVIVGKRRRQKFHYEEIREVLRRRYLLQQIGLEIFCTNGRTNFLAFPRDISNRVMSRLLSLAPNITDSAMLSVAGQKRGAQVEPQSGLFSSLIGETSVTQRWVRGEISNFQYLMFLNTLAGRSYNDLMQYPVFPWIIADYDSDVLDLNNAATFRDLSKPMGAQTEDRLQSYTKRYREWDPHTKDTPFFYGTHYSTAMIVASYLVRLEPFTQYFLHLQGGHFDLADRMFNSIKEAWWSAAKNNMADVKELIPEFFYLPDFLLNANKFDLGTKQSGVQLGDTVLPPWAKGDAREFIRMHREALECDYVSQHLHEWIDLVFGSKQQGQAAVDAVNLFHGWMYEGAVDLDKMTDPLEKQAFIAFINNFGQVPSQIFKKPHPLKKATSSKPEFLFHHLGRLQPLLLTGKELRSPVGHIIALEKNCIPMEQNKAPIPPHFQKYLAWGFPDHSLRICSFESDRPVIVYELRDEDEILCAVCPTAELYLVAGMSGVISAYVSRRRRIVLSKHLYGHYEPVTCLAASSAYSIAISGSKDRTCIIWDLQSLAFVRQLRGHPLTVSAVGINDLTGDVATAAGTVLFYWDINGHLLAKLDIAQGTAMPSDQILCVAFSQVNEWDPSNVIVTGGNDGCLRLWSEEMVRITNDKEEEVARGASLMKGHLTDDTDQILSLRRLSIQGSVSASTMDTRSDLRTQETEDLMTPTKEETGFEPDDDATVSPLPTRPKEEKPISNGRPNKTPPDILVDPAVSNEKPQWQRRLTLRKCINMQALASKKVPGGGATTPGQGKGTLTVTAVSFSKDHKALHVGDSQGRVTTWLSPTSGW